MNKTIRYTFLFIILAELLSFLGYFYPPANTAGFFAIAALTLILSFYKLEYVLYILLVDLLIDSMGYLFSFKQAGIFVSIRLVLWLIVMSVWLGQILVKWTKNKKLEINFKSSAYFSYFLILFIFIAWGIVNGLINHNGFSNIFFDSNGWLFFALVLPIYDIMKDSSVLDKIRKIFLAAALWLSVKTIILLYFFSHHFKFFNLDLYRWIRDTRVGEITEMSGGFTRIFIQSQIFILIGLFLVIIFTGQFLAAEPRKWHKKLLTYNFLLLTSYFAVVLIGFSRSFWAGLVAGLILLSVIYVIKEKISFKNFISSSGYLLAIAIVGIVFIGAIVKFPLPITTGELNPAAALEERASQLSGEAGAASRWQLLTPLWQKIKTAPILGQGFGSTVTYKSSDPRVLASSPSGLYATYAFEWGWLDVWLKLGLLGLLAYLALIGKITYDVFKHKFALADNKLLAHGLVIGLVVIAAVNIFSPYLNHPLGIGYIIISAAIMEVLNKKQIKQY